MTLQSIIDISKNIVFLGGAGVSTESGIPDFRSADGLYRQKFPYPPETMLSRSFFNAHTEEFFVFYRAKMICTAAKPNAAHIKLAELEAAGKLRAVVTQNIDGLHTAAGSKNVLELHGSVLRNHCMGCGASYDVNFILNTQGIPRCSCGSVVKPDVVLYEENLPGGVFEAAANDISQADCFIVGGASLNVYPAAGLVDYYRGNHLVLINKSPTAYDRRADLLLRDSIGVVLGGVK